jgi:hypothetical protein
VKSGACRPIKALVSAQRCVDCAVRREDQFGSSDAEAPGAYLVGGFSEATGLVSLICFRRYYRQREK